MKYLEESKSISKKVHKHSSTQNVTQQVNNSKGQEMLLLKKANGQLRKNNILYKEVVKIKRLQKQNIMNKKTITWNLLVNHNHKSFGRK